MSETPGAAVIGMGCMGRVHASAYASASAAGLPCALVAVCDPHPEKHFPGGGAGNLGRSAEGSAWDASAVRGYTRAEEVLDDPRVSLVSICTPTDTHVPLALAALRAGKHVLVEKPVALRTVDVKALAAEAARSPSRCMPAMCMRFWPGWTWLYERVRAGDLGPLTSLCLQRLGASPPWSREFYGDEARSGNALTDLHVHDADFVHWCLGPVAEVSSAGSPAHLTTLYRTAPGGPAHVTAEGAWDLRPGAGFRMRYLACFEHATAEFDLGRSPTTMLHDDAGSRAVDLPPLTAYEAQVRHFVEAIVARGPFRVTMSDAVAVARILDAERESLRTRRPVAVR